MRPQEQREVSHSESNWDQNAMNTRLCSAHSLPLIRFRNTAHRMAPPHLRVGLPTSINPLKKANHTHREKIVFRRCKRPPQINKKIQLKKWAKKRYKSQMKTEGLGEKKKLTSTKSANHNKIA